MSPLDRARKTRNLKIAQHYPGNQRRKLPVSVPESVQCLPLFRKNLASDNGPNSSLRHSQSENSGQGCCRAQFLPDRDGWTENSDKPEDKRKRIEEVCRKTQSPQVRSIHTGDDDLAVCPAHEFSKRGALMRSEQAARLKADPAAIFADRLA